MAESTLPVTANTAERSSLVGDVGTGWRSRVRQFTAQPAIRQAMPALGSLAAVGVLATLYLAIAQGPQRVLYSGLSDADRAGVVDALERGSIAYDIDTATGAITVAEDDIYRARMLVASDGSLAAPSDATQMLDSIPLGSSRTLEGERLRLARERELTMTIREIDGIEAVRVHLATPERSVFVRDKNAPSASVMVRLASGRSLGQSQVEAIVNLVSGSVPGMTVDAVRVVDQNGRLLSSVKDPELDGLVLQREHESKLQSQIAALLTPLLGDGNFSSQVQVELNQDDVTSARESYEREGAVRSESERNATRANGGAMRGVPGVTANTPPPDAELVDEAPQPNVTQAEGAATGDSETSIRRDYELGREVAVTNSRPGSLIKLSVAVAVSEAALDAAAPLTAEEVQSLVSAAVGANEERGDRVEIAISAFGSAELTEPAFYEQPWFAQVLRYATALIAILLVLFLVIRPMMKRMRQPEAAGLDAEKSMDAAGPGSPGTATETGALFEELPEQVELARRLAASQPERAVEALQRMLAAPADPAPGGTV